LLCMQLKSLPVGHTLHQGSALPCLCTGHDLSDSTEYAFRGENVWIKRYIRSRHLNGAISRLPELRQSPGEFMVVEQETPA